ncbi:MAG: DNA polymerase III subunit beta [Lachnospiraceae bacterium]|nr:DNA polymerase III subunit beta [Lachnospiraceae bacterium]
MKIICNKSDLMKALNTVTKAVPANTTMPILKCVLIDASSSDIKFTANDMELGIETNVNGFVSEKGKIALDAKLFSDIIRKLPESDVTICVDEKNNVAITCEKSKFNIMGLEPDDFPYLPFVEKDYKISLSQFTLKEVIRQTIFSIAANDSNKVLTGELFDIKENQLRVISLDGHRISIRRIELKDPYENKKVIVPGKTLSEISKILSGGTEDTVDIYVTENHILFAFDENIVVSRLIEGSYFQVDKMISNAYETKITINRQDFMSCIDRATLMVKEGDNRPIILTIDDNVMDMKISSQIGTMNDNIEVEQEGKPIKIGFNPRLLLDAMRVIDDELVDIYYMNTKSPCFIRDEAGTYNYMILPVNFVD